TAADMGVRMVGMTLLHQNGYFFQKLDERGVQTEEPDRWVKEDFLTLCDRETSVSIEGREVKLRIWKYEIKARTGFVVPVYFLDSAHPDNSAKDAALCSHLYNDDPRVRL